MMISTKGRYALMIMTYIAKHSDQGAVALKDIARENDMGIKYLETIIALLSKAGLVDSVRGKNGGYMLNKKPKKYTVYEILIAAEGELLSVPCLEKGFCKNATKCNTNKMWKGLDKLIISYLKSKTLEDIM